MEMRAGVLLPEVIAPNGGASSLGVPQAPEVSVTTVGKSVESYGPTAVHSVFVGHAMAS